MPDTRGEAEVVALLARAHDAVADGRIVEALDWLTQANMEHRSPAIERRLVELRHDAFAAIDLRPGRPEWPVSFRDPFPDETAIPRVVPDELTGDTLGGALVNHGCLRVDGLLGTAEVTGLIGRIDEAFDARDRLAEGKSGAQDETAFVPFEQGRTRAEGFGRGAFIRAVDAPGALFDLAHYFSARGVTAAVTAYFGERPAMIANKWVLRRTTSGKIGTDFHQDGAFLGLGIRTVDCWIALSDCGPGTGRPAIDLVARRFPLLDPGQDAAFEWSLSAGAVEAAAAGVPVLSPVFAAGDALFFDELLPHRTSVGLDLTTRYAVESWFVAPSSYPSRHVPVVL